MFTKIPPPPPQNWNFSWKTQGLWFLPRNHTEYPILNPPTPPNRTSHGWTSGKSVTRIHPPPIGTSHEELGDFGSELTKNTPVPELELLMEGLGTSVLSIPRIPPPNLELLMEDCAGDWYVETNRCIPCGYRLVIFKLPGFSVHSI